MDMESAMLSFDLLWTTNVRARTSLGKETQQRHIRFIIWNNSTACTDDTSTRRPMYLAHICPLGLVRLASP
jgi:hypothetical protein